MTDRDELRIALIGAGRMGADHARRISGRISGARLAHVSDLSLDNAKRAAAGADCAVGDDPLAAVHDPGVDAVLLATPGPAHEELLLACLERGLPVLCEKPLTPDSDSALRVVRAEAALGRRTIQVGFMRRFDPEYVHLKALLDARELGAPLTLHCAHRNASSPPGFSDDMMITDSVVHEADTARWLLGEEITEVSVLRPRRSALAPEGLADPQLVLMRTASGTIVDVEIFVNCGFGYQVRCEAVCERGTALVGADHGVLRHTAGTWGGTVAADFRDRFERAYDDEVRRWVAAARDGGIDGPDAWDGYAAAAVTEAGVRAQATGGWAEVRLAERPPLYR
ncbi:Gfo/Idh/MocA family protein [Marinitenerispora sediminis]|uniref:Inositol 2-dehydrogenase n=1 Tax=Marinitenerispora sediminis TaxID=1931232 RepID=A0A368T0A6_9ACTN|nr:Gfo/Idh/MocA family oxidoreductase [Marinitenerispora sediminis]RCV50991.1 inositol 2-dehydrogenase [Marinitenerispora sediminis]RCV52485.1 inositol 2-dehydrogenase [Marinitenerispora sediminis]RCV53836.1 inositol 2-dehydrogenase [Marinitenerispora sediminis]